MSDQAVKKPLFLLKFNSQINKNSGGNHMVYRFRNGSAKRFADQAAELSELRDAVIELAQIISEEGDGNG